MDSSTLEVRTAVWRRLVSGIPTSMFMENGCELGRIYSLHPPIDICQLFGNLLLPPCSYFFLSKYDCNDHCLQIKPTLKV